VINGQLKGSDSQYHGVNPFTEENLWPAPVASEQDLEEAVLAANIAFKRWQCTAIDERQTRCQEFAEALNAQKDAWTDLIIKEAGQPVSVRHFISPETPTQSLESIQLILFLQKEFAASEIDASYEWLTTLRINFVPWTENVTENSPAQIKLPEYVTHEDDEVKVITKYYPLGVVAGICPWNFPLLLAAGKIASAIMTGNTIIIKPS
jgi:acyl-CoA reductase-like NAD-dependent aldehyde dehydrogenase